MVQERKIVVTGISRGLGRAMVEGFVQRGHTVAGCSRSKEAVDEMRRLFPSPHRFHAVDVTDDVAVGAWAADLLAEMGPPDLLVNSAALINRNAVLWEVPPDEFAELVDVNVTGMFHVIRHFAPAMIEQSNGVIANFSSTWGRTVSPEVAPYCATKWAVEGLTQAMALELPGSMAAVPVNPGIIHTAMLESCFGGGASAYPSPDQWAKKAVPFLLQLGRKDNGVPVTVPS